MTKSVYLILGSTIIIGLSIFSMTQFGTIIEKEKTIKQQLTKLSDMTTELEGEITANGDLRAENEVLKEEISMLRDSIYSLREIKAGEEILVNYNGDGEFARKELWFDVK